jgi:hypothetical protein
MNFNVYLDDETARKLERLAKRSGESRNAVIRRAVNAWIERDARKGWPESVLNWKGEPDMPPFEETRGELLAPSEDPFG